MKTSETKTTASSRQQSQQGPSTPFFQKEGTGSFFSEGTTHLQPKSDQTTLPFFNGAPIQAKLTIGQPGDKYEVEADLMAEQVVDRISSGESQTAEQKTSVNPGAKPGPIQAKEEAPTKEEGIDKKEEEKPVQEEPDLQKKPAFESSEEKINKKPLMAGANVQLMEQEGAVDQEDEPISAVNSDAEAPVSDDLQEDADLSIQEKHQPDEGSLQLKVENPSFEEEAPSIETKLEQLGNEGNETAPQVPGRSDIQAAKEEEPEQEDDIISTEDKIRRKEIEGGEEEGGEGAGDDDQGDDNESGDEEAQEPSNDDPELQRKKEVSANTEAATPQLQSRLESSKGGGQPLSSDTQASMGAAFGADFSGVRVHTDGPAIQMSKDLRAQAFTHGSDIYFNEGKYDTGSSQGKTLLAHELTHTIQQGGAKVQKATEKNGEGEEHQTSISKKPEGTKIQKFDLFGAARRVGRGIVSGARAVGRGISSVVEGAMSMGRSALMAVVRRISPDFARLIERDGIRGFLRNLIRRGFQSLFGGVIGRIRSTLNFGGLVARIRGGFQSVRNILSEGASNAWTMVRTVATRVGGFISRTISPVFDRIRSIGGRVKDFFSGIHDAFGVPIMDFLRRIGGNVWEGLRSFTRRVGSVFRTVKNALGGAWTRIKGWFGITAEEGTSEGGGIWEWIKGKALALWDRLKQAIEPVKGPLRTIGSILVMLSPAGPAIALFRAWPHLKRAFNWIRQQWRDANIVVRARQYLNTTLLPMLTNGLQQVGFGMVRASDWLIGLLSRLQTTANNLLNSAGQSPLLIPLRGIANFALNQFRTIVTWVRNGIHTASSNIQLVFERIRRFLRLLWDVIRQIIAIVVNPFGIPGLVLGLAWRALPDNLKGRIIEWILDLLIRVIRVIPSNPLLGFLWPFIKNALLGFLERMKQFDTERKVRASNKMATIMSGGSASFAFGYLRGLVMGLWEGITGPFVMIRDLFQLPGLIGSFVRSLGERFGEMISQARELLASIASNAMGTFDSLMNGLRGLLQNPMRLLEMIRTAIETAMNAIRDVGSQIAERLMNIMEQPDERLGEMLGNLMGQALFEGVLTFFTAGGSAALTAIRQIANFLRRVARNLMRVIRMIMRFMPRVGQFIRRLGGLFGRARAGAGGVLQRISRFFDRVMDWFRGALRRGGRGRGRARGGRRARGRGDATPGPGRRGRTRPRNADGPGGRRRRRDRDRDRDNTPSWRRIRSAIRRGVLRFERRGGTRQQVLRAARSAVMRFRGARPRVRSEGEAKWQVEARHPRLRVYREVADVFKDRTTRWRLGRIAVRRRLARLRDNQKNIPTLRRILLPLKREYGYNRLVPENDPRELDINIIGGMSPDGPVAETGDNPLAELKRRVAGALRHTRDTGAAENQIRQAIRDNRNTDVNRVIRSIDIEVIGSRRKRYKAMANIRGSSRRREIVTIRKLASGNSREDALPITWYRGRYPRLRLRAKDRTSNSRWDLANNPPRQNAFSASIGGSSRLVIPKTQGNAALGFFAGRRTVTLGVARRYLPRQGSILRRTRSSSVRGNVVPALRTLLRNYNVSQIQNGTHQVDHVMDLGFGGPDAINNLWPLASGSNARTARQLYGQRIFYERNRRVRAGSPGRRFFIGKWFRIKNISTL